MNYPRGRLLLCNSASGSALVTHPREIFAVVRAYHRPTKEVTIGAFMALPVTICKCIMLVGREDVTITSQ